jgi:hypothetical protein
MSGEVLWALHRADVRCFPEILRGRLEVAGMEDARVGAPAKSESTTKAADASMGSDLERASLRTSRSVAMTARRTVTNCGPTASTPWRKLPTDQALDERDATRPLTTPQIC